MSSNFFNLRGKWDRTDCGKSGTSKTGWNGCLFGEISRKPKETSLSLGCYWKKVSKKLQLLEASGALLRFSLNPYLLDLPNAAPSVSERAYRTPAITQARV